MKNIKKILINAIMKIINRVGQEQIIDNINKELYIKEYEKDDFTAEYSYCDVFTSNKRYFLDLEFAHKKNRIVSDIASIGCVLKIGNEIIDSFHMIYNKNSDELTKNLKDSILNGVKTTESKEDMFIKFKQFLNKNGNHPIIVWGDDGQLLNKESLEFNINFKYIHDISGIVSNLITYKGQKANNTISLENMKKLYGIQGKVLHNALSDAIDLSNVFECYLERKEPNMDTNILISYFKNNFKDKNIPVKIDNEINFIINKVDFVGNMIKFKKITGEVYSILSLIDSNIVNHPNIIEFGDEIINKNNISSIMLKAKDYEIIINIQGREFKGIIKKNIIGRLESVKNIYNKHYKSINKKNKNNNISIKELITNKNYKMSILDIKFNEYKMKVFTILKGCKSLSDNVTLTKTALHMGDKSIRKDKIVSLNLELNNEIATIIINERYRIEYSSDIQEIKTLVKWLNKVIK